MLLAILSTARFASATVQVTGDVYPSDNRLTPNTDEGLPSQGNFISPFLPAGSQVNWEGIVNPANPATNLLINEIVVGKSALGVLVIQGAEDLGLNQQTLTIGGSGPRDASGSGQDRAGTGVVRISGFGAYFNNDPTILPAGIPAGTVLSPNPRPLLGWDGEGNDVYIGRAGTVEMPGSTTSSIGGTGTLEISAGGRAEIQDAVVAGNDPNSTGYIIVDGFDSYLGSGGFPAGGSAVADPHQMLIGRRGVGYMTIANGGTVRSDAPLGGGSGSGGGEGPVGAVIGGDSFEFNDGQQPLPGGTGSVLVSGIGSKWIVSGSLQVGGFSLGPTLVPNPAGDDAEYGSQAGRGTLRVQAGAAVNIFSALDAIPTDPRLFMAIGRFGRVEMEGGLITVGSATGPNNNDARENSIQLLNDGVITGSGRIETGVFNNRYYGEVRVSGGQKLVIDSSADFAPGTDDLPLTNYGVIQALGTGDLRAELEFDRAPSTLQAPIQPFQNLRVERPTGAPIGDFYGGLISAQSAILRFRSGIQNSGMMAFTAGVNYVTGNVVNMPGPIAMPADTGIITITGPGTKVVFENDLINAGGVINIGPGTSVDVLARHSFVTTGTLNMALDPEGTTQIFSAGDAGIAGKLSVSLVGFSAGKLQVGDLLPILTVGGILGGVDFTDPLYPKVDTSTPPFFSQVAFPNLAAFGLLPTTALVPRYFANSILLEVVSQAAAVGPDFNGDGVVNSADLNVWLANVGITSGASVTQGDADADGDVDGDDFLFWQRNAGQPMPWTGSGAGSGSGAAVPEPTGLALMLVGAMFSLVGRRSR